MSDVFVRGKRIKPVEERFWEKVDKKGNNDCWNWKNSKTEWGYGRINGTRAHRVSWKIFNGKIPDGFFVLHACDNPACVNPAHLFLGNAKDNSSDMVKKGRSAVGDRNGARTHPDRVARGERGGNARLKEFQVVQIRTEAFAIPPKTRGEIAKQFGISPTHVGQIIRRERWAHIS